MGRHDIEAFLAAVVRPPLQSRPRFDVLETVAGMAVEPLEFWRRPVKTPVQPGPGIDQASRG